MTVIVMIMIMMIVTKIFMNNYVYFNIFHSYDHLCIILKLLNQYSESFCVYKCMFLGAVVSNEWSLGMWPFGFTSVINEQIS
jgi:hypothetical protein